MRRNYLLLLFMCLTCGSAWAQLVPQEINYQAVVRDVTGAPLPKDTVINFSVTFENQGGTVLHQYTTSVSIQDFGVVSFPLDASAVIEKQEIAVIEIAATGLGLIGRTELKSVPYAFVSGKAEVADSLTGFNAGDMKDSLALAFTLLENPIELDGDTTNEIQSLSLDTVNRVLAISKANSVDFSSLSEAILDSTEIASLGFTAGPLSDNQILEFDEESGVLTIVGGNFVQLPLATGGDNWGSQSVETDTTLAGNGRIGDPLTVVGDLTDDQRLVFNPLTKSLSIDNGNLVDLSSINETLDSADIANLGFLAEAPALQVDATLSGDGTLGNELSVVGELTDNQSLLVADDSLKIEQGSGVPLSTFRDDLGSHQAEQNLEMGVHWISFDGTDNGVLINPDGSTLVQTSANVPTLTIDVNRNGSTNGVLPAVRVANMNASNNGDAAIQFEIDGDAQQSFMMGIDDNGGNRFKINPGTVLGSLNAFVIEPNGNVGVNRAGSIEKFEVNGNTRTDTLKLDYAIEFEDETIQTTAATDDQQLGFDNSTGTLSLTNSVDVVLPLGAGGDNWGVQTVATDGSIEGNGTSGDPLRLVGGSTDDQELSFTNPLLSLEDGGTAIDLSVLNTDEQTLSLNGTDLQISGSGSEVDLALLQDNLGNHQATENIQTRGNWISNTGGDEGIFVDGDGKIGVGTDAPSTPISLLVNGAAFPVGVTQNSNVGGTATLEFTTEDGNGLQATRQLFRGANSNTNVEFYRGNSGQETLALILEGSSGNLGVGDGINPSQKLDIDGNVRIRGTVAPTVGQVLTATNTNGTAAWQDNPGDVGSVTAGEGLINGGLSGEITLDVKANNGLTTTPDSVKLGGELLENTTLGLGAFDFLVERSGTNLLDVNSGGYVQMERPSNNNSDPVLWLANNDTRGSGDAAMRFTTNDGSQANFIMGIDDSDGNKFKVASGTSLGGSDLLILNGAGQLGIGVDPTSALHMSNNAAINVNDGYISNVRQFRMMDYDDDNGLDANVYRILARDGAFQFFNGGVVVGKYSNGGLLSSGGNLGTGNLVVEARVGVNTTELTGRINVSHNSTFGDPTILLTELATNDGARVKFENASVTSDSWTVYGKPHGTPASSLFNVFNEGLSQNVLQLRGDGAVLIPSLGNGSSTQAVTVSSNGQLTTTALINGVTAGNGLTGGGTSGSVNLNVVAGSGLTANANDIELGGQLSKNVELDLNGFNALFKEEGNDVVNFNHNGYVQVYRTADNGNAILRLQNTSEGTAGDASLSFQTSTDDFAIGVDQDDADKFKISTGVNLNNGVLTLTQDGLVGVGTTTPYNTFHVHVDDIADSFIGFTNSVSGNENNSKGFEVGLTDEGNGMLDMQDDRDIYFRTNSQGNGGQDRMIIRNDGRVGIGTNEPAARLEVYGDVGNGEFLLELDNSGNGDGDVAMVFRSPQGSSEDVAIGFDDSEDGNIFKITKGSKLGDSQLLSIDNNNNIGIGTNDPGFPLDVQNSVEDNFENTNNHTRYADEDVDNDYDQSPNISIKASRNVLASGFIAESDRRIKKDFRLSNREQDLHTLMSIEIVDYRYIDTISKGNKVYKKTIAQQVSEVYPTAVNKNTPNVIPDIYRHANMTGGWIDVGVGVKPGDEIRLIYDGQDVVKVVQEAGVNGFQVDADFNGEVFVYGHRVRDFQTVDYEAISMLNVSATQEIYSQVEDLKSENAQLQLTNEQLMKELEQLKSDADTHNQENQAQMELLLELRERLQAIEVQNTVGQK